MLDLKPYGAFVENTVRPMLEELTLLATELGRYDLVPQRDIPKIIRNWMICFIVSVIFDFLKTIGSLIIIGFIVWKISV